MTALALTLILIAAALHATWNLAAKRAASGLPFVWASGVLSLVLWTPLAFVTWWRHPQALTAAGWWFMALSGVLHGGYALFLQRAYRAGDFSLVYPVARGTGPLLSSLAAIAFLGERPSPLALAGGITIIASIFWLTGGFAKIVQLARGSAPSTAEGSSPYLGAIGYGIGTGAFIAAYTVADRQGVTIGGVQPLILDWGGNVTRTALFAPFAIKRWPEVRAVWRDYKLACFTVAVLGPLAYILVLWALTFTPLTYVAPTREVSILFGAMLGARLLNEGDGHRRLIAAAAMALGVGALALG
jgi:drug/metabolite transporter (DMT)-like permease